MGCNTMPCPHLACTPAMLFLTHGTPPLAHTMLPHTQAMPPLPHAMPQCHPSHTMLASTHSDALKQIHSGKGELHFTHSQRCLVLMTHCLLSYSMTGNRLPQIVFE